MEGTTGHPSALAITRYADELFGAVVRTFINKRGDRHVLEVQASVPEEGTVDGASEVFERVQDLMFELIADPLLGDRGFVAENVERAKSLHQKRIQSVYDDKIAYAMERCLEEVCAGAPEGLPRLGFLEDLAGIDGERLWSVHQEVLSTSDVHVYVVGNVAAPDALGQKILENLMQRLGAGHRAKTTAVRALEVKVRDVRKVVDRQPVQQGKLNLGFRTGVSYGDPDYLPLLVANGILGGFPHSKLFMNVRERASLAYYASSRLDGLTGIVAVQTGIEVANRERAEEIILQQVEALKKGEITDEELEFTKRGLRNQYLQVLDQPLSMAEIHFSSVLAGLQRDVEDLLNRIAGVTKEDAVRAANHLQLDTVYFLTTEEGKAGA
jgi:predicted Zn-dependent peptidase